MMGRVHLATLGSLVSTVTISQERLGIGLLRLAPESLSLHREGHDGSI